MSLVTGLQTPTKFANNMERNTIVIAAVQLLFISKATGRVHWLAGLYVTDTHSFIMIEHISVRRRLSASIDLEITCW